MRPGSCDRFACVYCGHYDEFNRTYTHKVTYTEQTRTSYVYFVLIEWSKSRGICTVLVLCEGDSKAHRWYIWQLVVSSRLSCLYRMSFMWNMKNITYYLYDDVVHFYNLRTYIICAAYYVLICFLVCTHPSINLESTLPSYFSRPQVPNKIIIHNFQRLLITYGVSI